MKKKPKKPTILISLGGSVLIPHQINTTFLKNFKKLILRFLPQYRFIIVTGGGKTARHYINAAKSITKLPSRSLDWLGIHTTRLNAHLLYSIFRPFHPSLNFNLSRKIRFKNLLISAGYLPGHSTDYDTVLLARTYKIKTLLNITNLDYLHDKNPKIYKHTKIIKQTNWKNFLKIIGKKWQPGLNVPFDPPAAKLAQKLNLQLILLGPSLENLENYLKKKKFRGSIVKN